MLQNNILTHVEYCLISFSFPFFFTFFYFLFIYRNKLTAKHILNLEELTTTTTNCLKNEFEMKDLGKTKFCLDLKIERLSNGIFVH